MLRCLIDHLEHQHRIPQPERVVVDPMHARLGVRLQQVVGELVQARSLELDSGSSGSSPDTIASTIPATDSSKSWSHGLSTILFGRAKSSPDTFRGERQVDVAHAKMG